MYKILIFIVLSIAAFSCNDRSAVEALQQQTESIHDEAMRDLAVMNRTKRELKKQADSLEVGTPLRDSLVDLIGQMETVDADMMAWMSTYVAPDKMSVSEAKAYLEKEKTDIEKNLIDIRTSIKSAESLAPKN